MNASPYFRTVFGLSASTNLLGIFEDPDLLIASRPVLPWEYDDFGGHDKGKKDSTQVGYGVKQAWAPLLLPLFSEHAADEML